MIKITYLIKKRENLEIMKKNKPFWIGIIIGIITITGFAIIPIIIELNKPPHIYYIATDDTYYSGSDFSETVNGNRSFLVAGRYINVSGSSFYYAFIKFDLKNIPKRWVKCEFSFYVYEYERNYWNANIMILSNDWNEEMNSFDIDSNLPTHSGADFYWEHNFGLQRIDITDFIGNNESITIRIGAHGTYSTGGSLVFINNYMIIYSKEADVDKAWLPQLIWS